MIKVNLPDGSQAECENKRVKEILKELHLNENSVLVSKGDSLLTPDISVNDGDEITVISVVSGG